MLCSMYGLLNYSNKIYTTPPPHTLLCMLLNFKETKSLFPAFLVFCLAASVIEDIEPCMCLEGSVISTSSGQTPGII